jgi:hypothetical protein
MKLWIFLVIVLTGCNAHHSFMDKALVADFQGRRIVVFHEYTTGSGIEYYRPQFQSDCRVQYRYEDNPSTGCSIRGDRLSNIRGYR